MSEIRAILATAFAGDAPRIGFGSGDLQSSGGDSDGARVVAAAYDAGFRYFDTARLYGDGRAEAAVRIGLSGKRHEVVIASKAGITPWSMRLGARLSRKALQLTGPLGRGFAPQPSARYGAFSMAEIIRSVETSLRALGTDHLDILLLHECSLDDYVSEQTARALDSLLRSGKIRAHGIAATHADSREILGSVAFAPAVVQAPADALNRQMSDYSAAPGLIIIHSILRPVLLALRQAAGADPTFAARFAAMSGIQPCDAEALAPLLLANALATNPGGIVLVSTRTTARPARLQEAARRAGERSSEVERLLAGLADLERTLRLRD